MMAKKFELWMGCLGNGITVCNKAVEAHGDYKLVAHISVEGAVHWYVKDDYTPPEERAKIEAEAEILRVKDKKRLDSLSPAELVEHLEKREEKSNENH